MTSLAKWKHKGKDKTWTSLNANCLVFLQVSTCHRSLCYVYSALSCRTVKVSNRIKLEFYKINYGFYENLHLNDINKKNNLVSYEAHLINPIKAINKDCVTLNWRRKKAMCCRNIKMAKIKPKKRSWKKKIYSFSSSSTIHPPLAPVPTCFF